jgi:hypothetical protein
MRLIFAPFMEDLYSGAVSALAKAPDDTQLGNIGSHVAKRWPKMATGISRIESAVWRRQGADKRIGIIFDKKSRPISYRSSKVLNSLFKANLAEQQRNRSEDLRNRTRSSEALFS